MAKTLPELTSKLDKAILKAYYECYHELFQGVIHVRENKPFYEVVRDKFEEDPTCEEFDQFIEDHEPLEQQLNDTLHDRLYYWGKYFQDLVLNRFDALNDAFKFKD